MSCFFLRTSLIIAGVCLLLGGLSMWLGAAPAHAQGEPPPRPTLTPVPPTPAQRPDRPRPTAAPSGRIAGTVIDLTTGAPAPNVAVTVGNQTVLTDANGNYDLSGLPAGSYPIVLALAPEQGAPAQEPVVIALAPDATVIQHLAFRSPAPQAPTPTAVVAPTALPVTSGAAGVEWFAIALGVGLVGAGLALRNSKARPIL
jgi:hypothetical protein